MVDTATAAPVVSVTPDMDAVVAELIKDQQAVIADFNDLKGSAEKFVQSFLGRVSNVMGMMPNEDAFLTVLAQYIDKQVDGKTLAQQSTKWYVSAAWKIFEVFGGSVTKIVLKFVLDKALGTGWYDKYLAVIKNIK